MFDLVSSTRPGLMPPEDKTLATALYGRLGATYRAGTRIITASDSVTLADLGKLLIIRATAGVALTLTAGANLTAFGFWCGIKRDDGIIAPVTLNYYAAVGATTVPIYQEALDLFADGSALRPAFQSTGFVPAGAVSATGTLGTTITVPMTPVPGQSNNELWRVDLHRLTTSAASTFAFGVGGQQITMQGVLAPSNTPVAFTASAVTSVQLNSAGTGTIFSASWEFSGFNAFSLIFGVAIGAHLKARGAVAALGNLQITTGQTISNYSYSVSYHRGSLTS